MSKPLSVQKPGLKNLAKVALRAVQELQARLPQTDGTHTQATTDAAAAHTALDTLTATIAAMS